MAGWSYDAANRFTGIALPNGITSMITPDEASDISAISHKGSIRIGNAVYSYDGAGHRISASSTLVRRLLDVLVDKHVSGNTMESQFTLGRFIYHA